MNASKRLWLIYLSAATDRVAAMLFDLAIYFQGVSKRAHDKAYYLSKGRHV